MTASCWITEPESLARRRMGHAPFDVCGRSGGSPLSEDPGDRVEVSIPPHVISSFMKELRRQAQLAVAVGKIPVLMTIARELFESVSVGLEFDPEVPGTHYLVVSVTASGDVREVANRRLEWYRRTHAVLGSASENVQLLIDLQE